MKSLEGDKAESVKTLITGFKTWQDLHRDFPVVRIQKCFKSAHKKLMLGIPRLPQLNSGQELNGAAIVTWPL
eukprot:8226394-Karenia_brevis.AAC.1